MAKKDDYFDDGISVDQSIDPGSTNVNVSTLDKHDFADLVKDSKRKSCSHNRVQTYKYVLGDVYRLCRAESLQHAMLLFGAVDPVRVALVPGSPGYILDIFAEHTIINSNYDGSLILEFPFK